MSGITTTHGTAMVGRRDRLRNLKTEVKLVIWDFNGCLLNDLEYMYQHGMCYIFSKFNLEPPSIEQYREEASADFLKFYHKYGISSSLREVDLNNILKESYLQQEKHPPLFDDVKDSLQKINWQGIDQAVVTAFNPESTREILLAAGVLNYFYEIRADITDKASVISGMMYDCQIEPKNVVGITDTVGDIQAFIKAGIKPYICHRGFHSIEKIQEAQEHNPEMIIVPNFAEIMKLQNWD